MANVFEYASVFQSELDKAAVEQATSGWMELNDKLVRYNGGAEVKIPAWTWTAWPTMTATRALWRVRST